MLISKQLRDAREAICRSDFDQARGNLATAIWEIDTRIRSIGRTGEASHDLRMWRHQIARAGRAVLRRDSVHALANLDAALTTLEDHNAASTDGPKFGGRLMTWGTHRAV